MGWRTQPAHAVGKNAAFATQRGGVVGVVDHQQPRALQAVQAAPQDICGMRVVEVVVVRPG